MPATFLVVRGVPGTGGLSDSGLGQFGLPMRLTTFFPITSPADWQLADLAGMPKRQSWCGTLRTSSGLGSSTSTCHERGST